MPTYREEAVVLRTHKLGEADRIVDRDEQLFDAILVGHLSVLSRSAAPSQRG